MREMPSDARRTSCFDAAGRVGLAPTMAAECSRAMLRVRRLASLFAALLLVSAAQAAVEEVRLTERAVVADGHAFGAAGPYEVLRGEVTLRLDPNSPANASIVDLALAPRDADGMVRARADLHVLQTVDPARRSGVGIVEVSNRGGKALSGVFDDAPFSRDPRRREEFGDALLLRRGHTLLWIGWQFDVAEQPDALRLHAPAIAGVEGLVRCDWVVDEPARELALGHRGHRPYRVAALDHTEHQLTRRSSREGRRELIPRDLWRFVGSAEQQAIELKGGFLRGHIYELVYRATAPSVVGIGFAALRDLASFAKHQTGGPCQVRQTIALGVSQSGRFLRHFLHQGFNRDETGRRAFDGLFVFAAGAGRGSFNHRFVMPMGTRLFSIRPISFPSAAGRRTTPCPAGATA